nr:hypothetical protein CFP56_07501 [Quercus suber]
MPCSTLHSCPLHEPHRVRDPSNHHPPPAHLQQAAAEHMRGASLRRGHRTVRQRAIDQQRIRAIDVGDARQRVVVRDLGQVGRVVVLVAAALLVLAAVAGDRVRLVGVAAVVVVGVRVRPVVRVRAVQPNAREQREGAGAQGVGRDAAAVRGVAAAPEEPEEPVDPLEEPSPSDPLPPFVPPEPPLPPPPPLRLKRSFEASVSAPNDAGSASAWRDVTKVRRKKIVCESFMVMDEGCVGYGRYDLSCKMCDKKFQEWDAWLTETND